MNIIKTVSSKSGLSAVVLKAMGLFGGLQIVGILSSIIRTKFVALWLGPAGVALFGIYNMAVDMISSATQLNFRSTAVREIAADRSNDTTVDVMIDVVRKWSWLLGLFGAVVMLVFAPLLSRWTFGDGSHTAAYIWLSVVMLLSSLTGGESAVLQGTQRLKALAVASMWGTVSGTVVSVPLFYFFELDSIIPSIIIYALSNLIAVVCMKYKPSAEVHVSMPDILRKGRSFIVLGVFMTVSAFMTQLSSYIFMAYLNHAGGESIVGFYQSGFTLINRYLGLVFTAMSMEYFPRLSSVSSSEKRLSLFVNHEILVVLLIMIPVAIIFIALRSVVVSLFLSSEFDVIQGYISWGVVGSILRAVSWSMAYVILVRGDGKTYFFTEAASCVFYLLFNYVGFLLYGVDGLGYAYCLWYLAYTILIGVICLRKYNIGFTNSALAITLCGVLLSILSIGLVNLDMWVALALGVVTLLFSLYKIRRLFDRNRFS